MSLYAVYSPAAAILEHSCYSGHVQELYDTALVMFNLEQLFCIIIIMALRHSRHHAGPEQMRTGGITAEARAGAVFAESRTASTKAESVTAVLKAEFRTIATKAESEKPSWQNL